jgi:hypothetical protein
VRPLPLTHPSSLSPCLVGSSAHDLELGWSKSPRCAPQNACGTRACAGVERGLREAGAGVAKIAEDGSVRGRDLVRASGFGFAGSDDRLPVTRSPHATPTAHGRCSALSAHSARAFALALSPVDSSHLAPHLCGAEHNVFVDLVLVVGVNFAGDGDVAWTPTAGPACRDLETAREPSHGSRACAPDVYPLRSCPRRRRGQGPSRRAREPSLSPQRAIEVGAIALEQVQHLPRRQLAGGSPGSIRHQEMATRALPHPYEAAVL